MPKHSTTRESEASRRAERLPGYILALSNNELTYRNMLKQDGECDACGARTTPVFQHKSHHVVFCQTCSQALIE